MNATENLSVCSIFAPLWRCHLRAESLKSDDRRVQTGGKRRNWRWGIWVLRRSRQRAVCARPAIKVVRARAANRLSLSVGAARANRNRISSLTFLVLRLNPHVHLSFSAMQPLIWHARLSLALYLSLRASIREKFWSVCCLNKFGRVRFYHLTPSPPPPPPPA